MTEALMAVEEVRYPQFLITYHLPHLLEEALAHEEVYFVTNPHKYPWKYVINTFQSLRIYLKKRPKFVLSTGSGMAIAMCLIGKFFGSRIIYIETGARIYEPSLTGRFMYYFSDLFIVQWEQLLKHFPSAIYGGLLF